MTLPCCLQMHQRRKKKPTRGQHSGTRETIRTYRRADWCVTIVGRPAPPILTEQAVQAALTSSNERISYVEAEEKAQPGEPEEEATAKDQPLVPLQIQEIIFYEDKLVLALVERDGKRIVAVPLRQFCTHLGVDWSGQLQRMKRDEVLVAEMMSVVITPTLIAEQDQPIRGQRRSQPATCLPLDIFPGWLFTITPGRVAPEHQAKIQRYRRRCYRVLAEAFASGELFGDEDDLPPPPGADTLVIDADDPLAVAII